MRITLSIPAELAERINERRRDRSIQEYTLEALREKVYRTSLDTALSPEALRDYAQAMRDYCNRLVGVTTTTEAPEPGITPMLEELLTVRADEKLGW